MRMKRLFALLLCACLALGVSLAEEPEKPAAPEPPAETVITLDGQQISVNGAPIAEDAAQSVYLSRRVERHEGVPESLSELSNRVITIASGGAYRVGGAAEDVQIAVRAGAQEDVRLILDGADISCRTAPAIVCYTARDPRTPGAYGFTIELAEGSQNRVSGSHAPAPSEGGDKLDGAIESLVSLGIEGGGELRVEADNEGIEVKYGHLTINGGEIYVDSQDDPLNVSEDGVGVLTMNEGYLFSSVKPLPGGEGDGMDSNGYIVFNGGVAISLAHPDSRDSGIDSDMGATINGGVIVGAGNMLDPVEAGGDQLFMMLSFDRKNSGLIVVTDENDRPVFAFELPHPYSCAAFSSPEFKAGAYRVYLGGEIEGEVSDGLYTSIRAYTPGTRLTHSGASAPDRRPGRDASPDARGPEGPEPPSEDAPAEKVGPEDGPAEKVDPKDAPAEKVEPKDAPAEKVEPKDAPAQRDATGGGPVAGAVNARPDAGEEASAGFVLSPTQTTFYGVTAQGL